MEIDLIVPAWFENLFCTAAYQPKTVVIGLKTSLPAGRSSADIIDFIPKAAFFVAFGNDLIQQDGGIFCRDPFDEYIDRCLKHQSIMNVIHH